MLHILHIYYYMLLRAIMHATYSTTYFYFYALRVSIKHTRIVILLLEATSSLYGRLNLKMLSIIKRCVVVSVHYVETE